MSPLKRPPSPSDGLEPNPKRQQLLEDGEVEEDAPSQTAPSSLSATLPRKPMSFALPPKPAAATAKTKNPTPFPFKSKTQPPSSLPTKVNVFEDFEQKAKDRQDREAENKQLIAAPAPAGDSREPGGSRNYQRRSPSPLRRRSRSPRHDRGRSRYDSYHSDRSYRNDYDRPRHGHDSYIPDRRDTYVPDYSRPNRHGDFYRPRSPPAYRPVSPVAYSPRPRSRVPSPTRPDQPPPPTTSPPPPPPPDTRLARPVPPPPASLPPRPPAPADIHSPPPIVKPPPPEVRPDVIRAVRKPMPPRRSNEQEEIAYGRVFKGCGDQSDYQATTKLGEGTFGEVHKAVHTATGRHVALKRILMHNEKEGMPVTALREIKILKALSHPCIVNLLDMFLVRSTAKDPLSVYMVFPYMDHDLAGLLENERVKLQPSQIKLYMKQLLEGTEYMHRNHILHRDMKAANLLISNDGVLQIADFGLARAFDSGDNPDRGQKERKYTNCVVTRWYRPPELLLGARQYGGEVDMWGIGCVLGEMFTRRPILPGNSDIEQLEKIFVLCGSPNQHSWPNWEHLPGCEGAKISGQHGSKLKKTFEHIGQETVDLLERLLTCNPRQRITAEEALDHDYFWTDPLPADPKTLPRYEASHEFDKRGQRQLQAQMQGPPPPQPPQPLHLQQPYRPPQMMDPNRGGPPPKPWHGQRQQAYPPHQNGPPPPTYGRGPGPRRDEPRGGMPPRSSTLPSSLPAGAGLPARPLAPQGMPSGPQPPFHGSQPPPSRFAGHVHGRPPGGNGGQELNYG